MTGFPISSLFLSLMHILCNLLTLSLSPSLQGLDPDAETIGAGTVMLLTTEPPIPVCIAYVDHPAYAKMAGKMKSNMEQYFNCSVTLYTGKPDERYDLTS